MSNRVLVSRPIASLVLIAVSCGGLVPSSIARATKASGVSHTISPRPAARSTLAQTREANERPGRVRIGTFIHNESPAVVCAP